MNPGTLIDYFLPIAMGLAGAALFHLVGPMLRGLWAVVKFPAFLILLFLDLLDGDATAWKAFYGKKPSAAITHEQLCRKVDGMDNGTASLINYHQGQLDSLAHHVAKAKVRLDALEERMDKVEAPDDEVVHYDPNALMLLHDDYDPGKSCGDGFFSIKCDPETRMPKAVPYAPRAGKPCPKPTKDLRPGDEVSVRVRVTNVGETSIHCDTPKDIPLAYIRLATSADELDKLRTDNK